MKPLAYALTMASGVFLLAAVIWLTSRTLEQRKPSFVFLAPKTAPKTTTKLDLTLETGTFTTLDVSAWRARKMSISCDGGSIDIDLRTGEVSLPKTISENAAARRFWTAVAEAFPDARREILESSTPNLQRK